MGKSNTVSLCLLIAGIDRLINSAHGSKQFLVIAFLKAASSSLMILFTGISNVMHNIKRLDRNGLSLVCPGGVHAGNHAYASVHNLSTKLGGEHNDSFS
jgi:hypothetical protein